MSTPVKVFCCRCGRPMYEADESGAFIIEKHPNKDFILSGICDKCPINESYFSDTGWFIDQSTDQERNKFIEKRIARYGS